MQPTLTTERLTLRPYVRADFDLFAQIFSEPRSKYMDGPVDRAKAWDFFTNDISTWHLNGWGGLAITDTTSGEVFGFTGLTYPPHFPEPEFGWLVTEATEGKGIATEAAKRLKAWVWDETDLATFVSYIAPENIASIRVAEKLGAYRDDACARPDDNPVVYRHDRPGGTA